MSKPESGSEPKGGSWTFEEWFAAQHGPRPSTIEETRLLDRIVSQEITLANDRRELARLQSWEGKRTSAQYAWNIKPEQKR